jgi:hypothetical protein
LQISETSGNFRRKNIQSEQNSQCTGLAYISCGAQENALTRSKDR